MCVLGQRRAAFSPGCVNGHSVHECAPCSILVVCVFGGGGGGPQAGGCERLRTAGTPRRGARNDQTTAPAAGPRSSQQRATARAAAPCDRTAALCTRTACTHRPWSSVATGGWPVCGVSKGGRRGQASANVPRQPRDVGCGCVGVGCGPAAGPPRQPCVVTAHDSGRAFAPPLQRSPPPPPPHTHNPQPCASAAAAGARSISCPSSPFSPPPPPVHSVRPPPQPAPDQSAVHPLSTSDTLLAPARPPAARTRLQASATIDQRSLETAHRAWPRPRSHAITMLPTVPGHRRALDGHNCTGGPQRTSISRTFPAAARLPPA
jgi:hypothetical protein